LRDTTPCAIAAVEAAIHRNSRRLLIDLRLLIFGVEHQINSNYQRQIERSNGHEIPNIMEL
jgi:hypothetical protein